MVRSFLFLILCLSFAAVHAQSITGKITDAGSKPVAGANVYVLNTQIQVVSNDQGEFVIRGLDAGTYQIQISALGYATLNRKVDASNNQSNFIFKLQNVNKQLDEVVVSAQKHEQAAQQVPAAVSVISSARVKDYRLWNTRDITAIVPNLYSANPGDDRNVTTVRGIATTSYDQAVTTYIDGVNQFGLDTYMAQLQDVERIEVLRGPQGTLYGRNAMGGVINIITKQPGNQTSGFAEANFGNYGEMRYNAGLRTPLKADKLFLGVAAMYNAFDGFYKNDFSNSSFDKQTAFQGNYFLKYRANDKLWFTYNLKHGNNRNDGAFPLVSGAETALGNPFRLSQNATTRLIDNVFNTSLGINLAAKQFNFSSHSAYQSNYRYYSTPIDGDFFPVDGISIINNYGRDWNRVEVLTQEFKFSSPARDSKLKWTGGIYAFHQDNPVKQGTHFGEDAMDMDMGVPFPNFASINTNTLKSFGLAVYGNSTIKLAENLNLSAGLRYDYEHKKQTIRGEFQMDGDEIMVTRTDTSATASYNAWSPSADLAWQLNESQMLYASYDRGFRAGGITAISADPSQPPLERYAPEYSNSFELGSKNTFWKNRFSVNLAAFYNRVTDAQVPTLVLPEAVTVIRNAAKLTSKGAELELAGLPLNGLKTEYSFGYTHARYTDLKVASNGAEADLNGNRQVFTPEITSMFAAQYSHSWKRFEKLSLVGRMEWKYLGERYFDLANQIKQSGTHLFNCKAGIVRGKTEFFVWSSNLFDEKYIDYAYDFGAVHLASPRTIGVSIATKF